VGDEECKVYPDEDDKDELPEASQDVQQKSPHVTRLVPD
jgi:hypothetical protein